MDGLIFIIAMIGLVILCATPFYLVALIKAARLRNELMQIQIDALK